MTLILRKPREQNACLLNVYLKNRLNGHLDEDGLLGKSQHRERPSSSSETWKVCTGGKTKVSKISDDVGYLRR